jgi:glutamate synthase (NADPH/NADH) small chain
MKLEKSVVDRRIQLLAEEGITFLTNKHVGRDYVAEELLREFDAVVLCCGSTRPRDLPISGRGHAGVHFAMEFLHANTQSLLNSELKDGNYISAKDKDVIVIGGGDTGTDCVATALRHGCKSLAQFEILPQPPQERSTDNAWPQWPKIYRTDYGQEEAAAVFGADPRSFSIVSKEFLGNENGQLRAVRTVQVRWEADGEGRSVPHEISGTEKEWPAQLVLLAMGFVGPETGDITAQLGVLTDQRGNIAVDEEKMTNIPKVFAAGDAARGQSLVVWAIADGRRAAKGVDKFLTGETSLA